MKPLPCHAYALPSQGEPRLTTPSRGTDRIRTGVCWFAANRLCLSTTVPRKTSSRSRPLTNPAKPDRTCACCHYHHLPMSGPGRTRTFISVGAVSVPCCSECAIRRHQLTDRNRVHDTTTSPWGGTTLPHRPTGSSLASYCEGIPLLTHSFKGNSFTSAYDPREGFAIECENRTHFSWLNARRLYQ